MAAFLSEDWFAGYRRAVESAVHGTGLGGTVRVTIEQAPQGKVVWIEHVEDGRVTAVAPAGAKDPADVELTARYPLALELWRDGLDPAVAFMQGRLKMNGDSGLWLRLLPGLRSERYTGALADLASVTEF